MARQNLYAAETFLILTSRRGLSFQAGASGVTDIFNCIGRIADVKRTAGYDVHVFVPDDEVQSTGDFPLSEGDLTARAVRDGLAEVERRLRPSGGLDYVLIIGDGDVIPFHYLENPAGDSDGEFPTDVPYAVADGGSGESPVGDPAGDAGAGGELDRFLLPDRMVARIPLRAESGGGLLPFLEMLASGGTRGPAREKQMGLSALQWRRESARVYGVLAEEGLMTSPPVDISGFEPGWLESEAVIYFNVHGSKDEEYWYGQKGLSYPRVLCPDIVAKSCPSGAIVLSEACYGGLVEGKTPADSVAMRFLERGVGAFVGSSAIAYGSPDEDLTEADLLAYLFFSRLVGGETSGRALREAKIDFAADMLDRQGYLDGDDRKTLLEFNLFGDPTVGIYKGKGLGDRSRDMLSDEVLASIKKIASQRFPEMDGVEPDVSEQTGLAGGVVEKKMGSLRPESTAKRAYRSQGRIFVASFRQTVIADGREVERVVRITFRETGQVIKVVTSK